MAEQLTAAEAAARLGIKRETLYAYVSRGLLAREMAIDGRSSLFDAHEVDDLRRRNRRSGQGELNTVITSSITRLSEDGHAYRGRQVGAFVADDVDFEAVADSLWEHEGDWAIEMPPALDHAQQTVPADAPALDRFRLAVAVLSATDPLRHDTSSVGMAGAGRRIATGMVSCLPMRGRRADRGRLADRLWLRLTRQTPTEEKRRALNGALVLLADHGLAASTFAVRIAASVRADAYSAVTAGLGVVGGSLHGAASSSVHRVMRRAAELGSPEAAVGEVLARNERLPGVGHTIYRQRDPRERVLSELVDRGWSGDARLEMVHETGELLHARADKVRNIDLSLGGLTYLSGMDEGSGEGIFAVARTAGWLAHAIEEHSERPVRFRPAARYSGPSG